MPTTIEQGEALLAEGQIEAAEKCFLEAVGEKPESRAYNNLGVVAYHRRDAQQAIEYFMESIRLDSANTDAVVNLCTILEGTGNLGEALELLTTLARQAPDNSEIADLLIKAKEPDPSQGSVSAPANSEEINILQKRVLHGSYEIANQMNTITGCLKHLGMKAETVCYYPTYLKYQSDHVLNVEQFKDGNEAIAQTRRFAEKLIPDFDIFNFHFGTTLTLDHSDLQVIEDAGKKMLMQYWGSDCRLLSRAKELNRYVKVKVENEDWIKNRLETISKFMPHCIVSDWELNEYVKDYFEQVHVVPVSMDLQSYTPRSTEEKNDTFLIVHAPTSPEIKGTAHILAAIEELKEKHQFEFKLIQGMAHDEAKKIYEQADLIIDQIIIGVHGLFAVESMAMGKPVIVWISDFMKEKYPNELPVMRANPDTIKDTIEWALTNREALPEIGMAGREYVEKYHDKNKNVHRFLEIYKMLYQ